MRERDGVEPPLKARLIADGVPPRESQTRERYKWNDLIKYSRNRRNGTKQEKHSVKGIAIAFATALFLNFSVKSLSRKVVQKF